MRFDVIGHARRRHGAALKAQLAERLAGDRAATQYHKLFIKRALIPDHING
jgi:hypothetical protein